MRHLEPPARPCLATTIEVRAKIAEKTKNKRTNPHLATTEAGRPAQRPIAASGTMRLVSVNSATRLLIRGGRPLRGRVAVSGSKNACLYALAAGLMTAEPVTLRNVPEIADIGEMGELLRALGATVAIEGDVVRIEARDLTETAAPADQVAALRASFLVMGPLLARRGEAGCPPPGGDSIGVRPLDVHLAGFKALGAEVTREGPLYVARATRLRGTRIFLDYPSVLGTVNVLFAAATAEGTTTIINAAAEPEVAMAVDMLVAMGARITGGGDNIITVEGVDALHGVDWTIIPDRIEAGTYLLAGIATGGDIEVVGAVPEHLDSLISKLHEAGVEITAVDGGLRAHRGERFVGVELQAVPYPGFATDLHAPMAAALTQASGPSKIHERVFENRFLYVEELCRLGAKLVVDGPAVRIEGPTRLVGAEVRAHDVRAGAAAVLAALCAEGETIIRDVIHIDRGYAHLVERLTALGADISRQ